MPIRDYNFITGPETETLPTASTPSDPSDLVTMAYLTSVSETRGVATVAAVKAIAAAYRTDNFPIFVEELECFFRFDSASSATGNDLTVIVPTAGTGRWIRVSKFTQLTLANNVAATNVTGLVFDKTKIQSFVIKYTIYRAGGTIKVQSGMLLGVTDGTNWEIAEMPFAIVPSTASDAGITFTITSAGQVQYASDDNSDAGPTSKLLWKIYDLEAV